MKHSLLKIITGYADSSPAFPRKWLPSQISVNIYSMAHQWS